MFIKRQDLEYASFLKIMESEEFDVKEKIEMIRLMTTSEDKVLCEWLMDRDITKGQDPEIEMKKFIYEKQFDFDTKELVFEKLMEQDGYLDKAKQYAKDTWDKNTPALKSGWKKRPEWYKYQSGEEKTKRQREEGRTLATLGGVGAAALMAGAAGVAFLMKKYGLCVKHCNPDIVKNTLKLGMGSSGMADKIYRVTCNISCKLQYNKQLLDNAVKSGNSAKASEVKLRINKYQNDMVMLENKVKDIENRLMLRRDVDGKSEAEAVRKAFEMATKRF